MVLNALSGKAGVSVGKPRVAHDSRWSVHSVDNEHGTLFIENRRCSWGRVVNCAGVEFLRRVTNRAKCPPSAGRALRHGDEGIGNMGGVFLESGYVFYHNMDAVLCCPGLTRFVLGGRNEKFQDGTDAAGHADSL